MVFRHPEPAAWVERSATPEGAFRVDPKRRGLASGKPCHQARRPTWAARPIFWLSLAVAAATLLPTSEASGPAAPAAEKIAGPRGLLELLGIDQSQFDRLADGVPWQESENELLLKMMFHLRDFRAGEIEGWARDDFPPGEAPDDVDAWRGEIFRLRGRVVRVDVIRPPAELRERFELGEYYRCRLLLEDEDRPAVVFAQTVPAAWMRGEPIDERAAAFGFFLKRGRRRASGAEPIFVARRLAWHPDTRLGNLGMDVGLFDDLHTERTDDNGLTAPASRTAHRLRGMRLTARNRECFYQLLAAAGRAPPGQLLRDAEEDLRQSGAESFSVVPLFNDPARQRGRLVVLSGTAREVIPIRVADEDVQARFGITHYYQIGLFTGDSQGNPLVFCVRELPEGMPTGKGPQFGESVTVAGFFFNTWAYHSQTPPEKPESAAQWQLAPLLIGRDLVWHPPQPVSRNPLAGAIAAGVFVLLLSAVWLMLWRSGRSDKRFRDQTLSRHLAGEPGVPLDRLGLETDDQPDFTALDQPPGLAPEPPDSGGSEGERAE